MNSLLLAALAEREGATVAEVTVAVHRRRADVTAALCQLEAAGLVERIQAPNGRAWNRRGWHLAKSGAGPAWDRRQMPGGPVRGRQVVSAGGSVSGAVSGSACRAPDAHRRFRWWTPRGRELCALCVPPAVSTVLRADALIGGP